MGTPRTGEVGVTTLIDMLQDWANLGCGDQIPALGCKNVGRREDMTPDLSDARFYNRRLGLSREHYLGLMKVWLLPRTNK